MDTHLSYKLKTVIGNGRTKEVSFNVWSGLYQDRQYEDIRDRLTKTVNEYVRSTVLKRMTISFSAEKSMDIITGILNNKLLEAANARGLSCIKEQMI